MGERTFEGVSDDVGRFVDIAKPMSLINDYQIPRGVRYIGCLAAGKLIGADDDFSALKWTEIAMLDFRVIRLCLKNSGRAGRTFPSPPETTACEDSKV